MSKKAGTKTRARQEEKKSSSSGGSVDRGGGAGENIDSESRASPSSFTSMPNLIVNSIKETVS